MDPYDSQIVNYIILYSGLYIPSCSLPLAPVSHEGCRVWAGSGLGGVGYLKAHGT